MVKNPPTNAGDAGDVGSIPGSGRSPGGGNGNPLQYSCLENPTDRGAWHYSPCGRKELDMTNINTYENENGFLSIVGSLSLSQQLTA